MTASSPAVRNAALLLGAEVVGKVATFGFTVVAARELSRADFGAFSYALAFAVLVTTVPNWGFNAVLMREGSVDPDRLSRYYSQALAWRLGLMVPTFAVAAVVGATSRRDDEAAVALVLVLVATGLDLLADTGKAAAAVRGRLEAWALGLVVNRILSAVAAVVVLVAGGGLVGAAAAYLAGSLSGVLVTTVAVARLGVRPTPWRVDVAGMRAMGRQSFALGLDGVAAMLLARVDTVILGELRGDEAVAVYSVGYRLLDTVLVVVWSLNSVVFPRLSAAAPAEVRRVAERALGAVAAVFVPFGVVLLVRGPEVVGLIFGGDYEQPAAGTVRWLSPTALVFAAGFFASAALLSRRRGGPALLATVVALAANVALNLALVPRFGPAGAAAATTAAYTLEAVVLLVLCGRLFGWVRYERAMVVPLLAAAPLALALLVVPGNVVVAVAVGGVLYAAAWLALVRRLSPDVVALLRGALRRRAGAPADVSD